MDLFSSGSDVVEAFFGVAKSNSEGIVLAGPLIGCNSLSNRTLLEVVSFLVAGS